VIVLGTLFVAATWGPATVAFDYYAGWGMVQPVPEGGPPEEAAPYEEPAEEAARSPEEEPAAVEKPTWDTLFGEPCFDPCIERMLEHMDEHQVPVHFGAWHWWQVDASGRGDSGYGCNGCEGTYFYYLTADPQHDLGGGRKIGGHVEYEFRDNDPLRTFFTQRVWSYEAYAYYTSDELGTLKAGELLNRFGLDWHGGFWTSVSGYDGFVRDPDYGLSWEKTTQHCEHFKVDRYIQFFFHENGENNSFAGGDSESFAGVNERNTGVVRFVPTWTCGDKGSTLAVGLSGMVGQIDSRLPGFADDVASAWALDATYTRDRWKLFGEVVQVFGRRAPVRYVSGGPSNRLTDFFFGAEYTLGPAHLRANYQLGLDANPHGRHELFRAGGGVRLTEHADLFVEYVNQHVYGHEAFGDLEFFNAVELILWWHY
jgi:predicted porin